MSDEFIREVQNDIRNPRYSNKRKMIALAVWTAVAVAIVCYLW